MNVKCKVSEYFAWFLFFLFSSLSPLFSFVVFRLAAPQCKGRAVPGIVEQVRDGSTFRVELLLPSSGADASSRQHVMIVLHLAGLQCPRCPLPLAVLQAQQAQVHARTHTVAETTGQSRGVQQSLLCRVQ
jgi:hypothetical protein